jgi:hypothetical protein
MTYITAPKTAKPASDKQVKLIIDLALERDWSHFAEDTLADLNAVIAGEAIPSKHASNLITCLFQCSKKTSEKASEQQWEQPPTPTVAEGRYALVIEGVTKFYKVDCPTQGKWKGYTFVKVMASDTEYPVKGATKAQVLDQIAVNPIEALARYGKEIGSCGRCGRVLTDETSRAIVIGPDCRAKIGFGGDSLF